MGPNCRPVHLYKIVITCNNDSMTCHILLPAPQVTNDLRLPARTDRRLPRAPRESRSSSAARPGAPTDLPSTCPGRCSPVLWGGPASIQETPQDHPKRKTMLKDAYNYMHTSAHASNHSAIHPKSSIYPLVKRRYDSAAGECFVLGKVQLDVRTKSLV